MAADGSARAIINLLCVAAIAFNAGIVAGGWSGSTRQQRTGGCIGVVVLVVLFLPVWWLL